jgi:hypothetical protein
MRVVPCLVDATYEGDLLAAANVSYRVGREPASTYNESLGGQWQQVSWKDVYQFCRLPISPYVDPDDPRSGLLPEISKEPAGEPGEGDFKVQAYNFRVQISKGADRISSPRPPGYDPGRHALLARLLNFDAPVEWRLTYTVAPMTDGPVQIRPGDSNNAGSFSTDCFGGNYRWPDGTYTPGSFAELPPPRSPSMGTTPCRMSPMTCLYNHQPGNGIASNFRPFPVNNPTHATLLRAAGHTTAFVGKWHMGSQRERPGFDHSASYIGHGRYRNCPFVVDGKDTPTTGWVDDVATDCAIGFIRRQKNSGKPWSMVLGCKTPPPALGATGTREEPLYRRGGPLCSERQHTADLLRQGEPAGQGATAGAAVDAEQPRLLPLRDRHGRLRRPPARCAR